MPRKGNEISFRKITLRTHQPPAPPPFYSAKDIQKLRKKIHYSQSYLAMVMNVSIRTVQSWECGRRIPAGFALRLLELIDKDIYRPRPTILSSILH